MTTVGALAGGAKYELINTGDDYKFFARHDGNRTLSPTLTLGTNYFIGTNQVQLNYDVTNSKFYWEWLHMPIYQSGTAIVSTYSKDPTLNTYYNVGKAGGIAWRGFLAYSKGDTSNPFDFWQDKLGFDLSKLCVKWTKI